VLVFLTDGQDNVSSSNTYDALIAWAQRDDVVIHTVGLGPGVNSPLLNRIAHETGGLHLLGNADDLLAYYAAIQGATDTTDSNADGITDYYTHLMTDGARTAVHDNDVPWGVRTGTRAKVFGNATYAQVQANSDFDADGIANGDEVRIIASAQDLPYPNQRQTSVQVYALLLSDPTMTDSDGDGYGDGTETGLGTSLMISDVDHYALSNTDYVPIGMKQDELGDHEYRVNSAYVPAPGDEGYGLVSYGGRQGWFYESGSLFAGTVGEEHFAKYGCGVIAAADLLAYLGLSDASMQGLRESTPGLGLGTDRTQPLPFGSYSDLTRSLRPDRLSNVFAWGLIPREFKNIVNTYYRDHQDSGGDLVQQLTDFGESSATVRQSVFLKAQLGRDIPVPWLHFLGEPYVTYYRESTTHIVSNDRLIDRNRDGQVDRYDYSWRELPLVSELVLGNDYYDLSRSDAQTRVYTDHYVIITEYIVDRIDGKEKVVFSSWGEKMVAELWRAGFGRFGGFYKI
jgi:hypothetical protein